MGTFF